MLAQVLGITLPAAVANAADPSLAVSVYQGNPGSSYQGFNGTGSESPNPQDLTTFGPRDWALWGYEASTALDAGVSKQGGTAIGALQEVVPTGQTAPARVGSQPGESTRPFRFSWSDGTPTATGSNADAGVRFATPLAGSGFRFSVPASPVSQRLVLFASVKGGDGILTLRLPGRATTRTPARRAAPTTTTAPSTPSTSRRIPGTSRWSTRSAARIGAASRRHSVTVYAAALAGGSDAIPPSLAVENPTPAAFDLLEDDLDAVESALQTRVTGGAVDTLELTATVLLPDGQPATGLTATVSAPTTVEGVRQVTITAAVERPIVDADTGERAPSECLYGNRGSDPSASTRSGSAAPSPRRAP